MYNFYLILFSIKLDQLYISLPFPLFLSLFKCVNVYSVFCKEACVADSQMCFISLTAESWSGWAWTRKVEVHFGSWFVGPHEPWTIINLSVCWAASVWEIRNVVEEPPLWARDNKLTWSLQLTPLLSRFNEDWICGLLWEKELPHGISPPLGVPLLALASLGVHAWLAP